MAGRKVVGMEMDSESRMASRMDARWECDSDIEMDRNEAAEMGAKKGSRMASTKVDR